VDHGLSGGVQHNCGSAPPRTAIEELEITSHDPNVGRFETLKRPGLPGRSSVRSRPSPPSSLKSCAIWDFSSHNVQFPREKVGLRPSKDTEEDSRHFGACRPN
jgi:hypothetical protein